MSFDKSTRIFARILNFIGKPIEFCFYLLNTIQYYFDTFEDVKISLGFIDFEFAIDNYSLKDLIDYRFRFIYICFLFYFDDKEKFFSRSLLGFSYAVSVSSTIENLDQHTFKFDFFFLRFRFKLKKDKK